jgi:glutathione synthase/RimK-type ligase-like ATP-grasp enzyme
LDSPRPQVIAVSDEGSPTVASMVARVRAEGGEAHVLSAGRLPRDGCVALDELTPEIVVDGTRVRLDDCAGIWVWHAERPTPTDADAATARYVRREWELTLRALAAITPRAIWINHPSSADWLEANKLEQMRLAARAGFDVPPTLLSNDPDRIVEFAARFDSVAVKSQGGVWRELPGGGMAAAYTQRCTSAELRASCRALTRAPVVVQPYLEKAYELRVTVIDATAFFCRIDSQASERTKVDWRRQDFDHVAHDLVEPRPEDLDRIHALVRAAGLRYAAIDLLCTPDGHTYFLDLNPAGQFGWIEALTGAPILETLAGALMRRSPGGGPPSLRRAARRAARRPSG